MSDLSFLEALKVTTEEVKEYVDGKSAVSYGERQTLTDAEKEQARSNIGAPAVSDIETAVAQKSQVQIITWEADD